MDFTSNHNGFNRSVHQFSRPGVIELLPACSEKFAKGTIEGVACRTQAKVDQLDWDLKNKIIKAQISTLKDQEIELILPKSFIGGEVKLNGKK